MTCCGMTNWPTRGSAAAAPMMPGMTAKAFRARKFSLTVPVGSMGQVFERFDDPHHPEAGGQPDDTTTPTAVFQIDRLGQYIFELAATDSQGAAAPSVWCPEVGLMFVSVDGAQEIRIELEWSVDGNQDPGVWRTRDASTRHTSGVNLRNICRS